VYYSFSELKKSAGNNSFQIRTNINSDSARIAITNTYHISYVSYMYHACVMHLFLKWIVEDLTRWWFQIVFISTPTWGRFPFWLASWRCVHPPVLQNSIGIKLQIRLTLHEPRTREFWHPVWEPGKCFSGRWWRLSRPATLETNWESVFLPSNVASSCIFFGWISTNHSKNLVD